MKKEIWTIDLSDIVNEEGINDVACAKIYYSADEAIEAAMHLVDEYIGDERVLEATVYAGQYEDERGNIFGETTDIFCATNVRPYKSAHERFAMGFVKLYIDYYAEDPVIPCEMTEYDGKQYKSALMISPDDFDNGADWLIVEDTVEKELFDEDNDIPVNRSAEMFDDLVYAYVLPEWFELPESEFVQNVIKYFT